MRIQMYLHGQGVTATAIRPITADPGFKMD